MEEMPAHFHSPEFKRSKLNGPSVKKSDFLATENKIASRVTNPEECLGTFLPLGLSCFVCRPAWRLLGVGSPACSFPFHRGGRKSSQAGSWPCQLSPLLTRGTTGRPEFLRTVVPTTGESPVGSLSPAYWAKGSSGTNACPAVWPVWEGDRPGASGAGASPWCCVPLAERLGRRAGVF